MIGTMKKPAEKLPVKRKMTYTIKWKVSEYRKDKRTGVINPGVRDPYTQMLMDEVEEFFRDEEEERNEYE
ncbi:hypothetical protein [Bacillus infantis]|uniref:hypothetical protein n=1 Tax=Bacillus infantis TaxID=324767 RepID=UPI00321B55F0